MSLNRMVDIWAVSLVALLLCLACVVATSKESHYVTCGSAVKLTHVESGGTYYLSSGEHALNSGSGQQLVTVNPDKSSPMSSLWLVQEGHGDNACKPGDKIPFGSKIRLSHIKTGKNLHSHHVHSPLSRQQEVTCFGDNAQGDTGDNWIVQPRSVHRAESSHYWEKDASVMFVHVDTGAVLGASNKYQFTQQTCGGRCPVMNHLEIFAKPKPDLTTEWKAELGVFLHK